MHRKSATVKDIPTSTHHLLLLLGVFQEIAVDIFAGTLPPQQCGPMENNGRHEDTTWPQELGTPETPAPRTPAPEVPRRRASGGETAGGNGGDFRAGHEEGGGSA